MTAIDALLARARLHHHPRVPADTIAYEDSSYFDAAPEASAPLPEELADDATATQHLDHLCEIVVTAAAPTTLEFLTDQVPEPPGAWLLGCALHLAGVDDGARFWWQYAAGAGHRQAAYCLFLHHHARGEAHAAAFWYDQADLERAGESDMFTVSGACPPAHYDRFDASIPTVLRVLSHLTAAGRRPRTHRAEAITNYVANAVTRGQRRHPEVEIPVPEARFADRVGFILAATPPWTRRMARVFNAPALPHRRRTTRANGARPRNAAVEGATS
ncbi:DUF6207 family protein [Streptomyces sp. NPDC054842]